LDQWFTLPSVPSPQGKGENEDFFTYRKPLPRLCAYFMVVSDRREFIVVGDRREIEYSLFFSLRVFAYERSDIPAQVGTTRSRPIFMGMKATARLPRRPFGLMAMTTYPFSSFSGLTGESRAVFGIDPFWMLRSSRSMSKTRSRDGIHRGIFEQN
jgi:hypothetical protein